MVCGAYSKEDDVGLLPEKISPDRAKFSNTCVAGGSGGLVVCKLRHEEIEGEQTQETRPAPQSTAGMLCPRQLYR